MSDLDILREASEDITDEWSENRDMGQDRTEWQTWRAVAAWLDSVADRQIDSANTGAILGGTDWAAAVTVARARTGRV